MIFAITRKVFGCEDVSEKLISLNSCCSSMANLVLIKLIQGVQSKAFFVHGRFGIFSRSVRPYE